MKIDLAWSVRSYLTYTSSFEWPQFWRFPLTTDDFLRNKRDKGSKPQLLLKRNANQVRVLSGGDQTLWIKYLRPKLFRECVIFGPSKTIVKTFWCLQSDLADLQDERFDVTSPDFLERLHLYVVYNVFWEIWFFVAIIRVSNRRDDNWGCNDCIFEKKTAVLKGLYCDPKSILCHCKIGGKLFCICPQENLFSCLTSLSEWPTGILI